MIRGQGTIKLYVVYNVLEVSINSFANLDYGGVTSSPILQNLTILYIYVIEFVSKIFEGQREFYSNGKNKILSFTSKS